ncbi:DUF2398 family protein [Brevibacillus laterosporus]|uniref:DUF2398 family protein n=1 Tax=Brevibacillus laterosporus TaxID=1465 RepID=A0AAP3G9L6_BRELA|nr:DUF2398 family protein [Brevibacillus laterosporus]MCR8982547.1 DUF2398 family protein [Brevibacillus laterosporus]MCZ0809703.1 DUF2398 family protein [Brevibacillus laterosporus]MCZ0828236.1 DUF2398 family protein [Brevibacillus laterosporus]MCZ0852258.1 DUF2398 family protein [Brevibacillus laterosporus]
MKKITLDRKEIIQELLDRFWVLKKDDLDLYYQVFDMQLDLRHFFSETFRYGLIISHDMVKLEKTPTEVYEWLGAEQISDFSNTRDFVFLFLLLSFLEGKNNDHQFLLQDICEIISASYPGEESITWKSGLDTEIGSV